MKKILVLTVAVLFLSIGMPEICQAGSYPKNKKTGAVNSEEGKKERNAAPAREMNSRESSEKKETDSDLQEPEYDMDLDIDPEDERC